MSNEKVHIMIKRWTKQISAVDFVLFIGIINLKVSLDTRNKTEVLTMKVTSKLAAILCAAALFMTVGCSNGGETSSGSSEPEASGNSGTADVSSASNSETNESGTVSEEKIMDSLNNGIIIDSVSGNVYKNEMNANPISPNIFCADPTAVEYNGRLYVYGTNDQQQSEEGTKNDYAHIKSLVVFSTDDMVNWIYHGRIEVGEIAPWINNSWAPSIASRVEDDGLTHFYLYFSNGGAGVGVITSTDPVGPWTDPLGEPLVYQNMPGLENCPAPFDPGVCIDENGVGWLSFGGGTPADGNTMHSKIPKIAKLGKDMLSFDSEFVSIDAPYFFEASELNYIDGVYYYTYCTDWQDHKTGWKEYEGIDVPPACSMAYMTTKTPLDADSWECRGPYFYNAGENADGASGLRWANNHTHFIEYKGVNYIIHHTLLLEELMGGKAGFRSMMADYLPMDKATGNIPITAASKKGVAQIKLVDPYTNNSGALMFTCADIGYDKVTDPAAKSTANGAWIYVRGADFGYGASEFIAEVKGKGRIEVRLDDISSKAAAFVEFDCADYTKIRSDSFAQFDGRNHDIYFVFSGSDIELKSWRFSKGDEQLRPEESIASTDIPYKTLVISGQTEPGPSPSAMLDIPKDGDYSIKSSSFEKDSAIVNLGFINTDTNAKYKVLVRSLTLATENGDVEVPVNKELDPTSSSENGLENGWGGSEVGSLIYGTEECGIFAAKTDITWTNYRLALKVNGEETPFTSITYNVTVSGLELDG